MEKDLSSIIFPHRSSVEFQHWPAAGSDSETEIGFTTKTGATHRNGAENRLRKLIVTQQVNWSQAPKWSYVPGPDLSRCLLVDASTCQQIERALWPWVRPGARIVEGQLALHGLFNAHTARHLQVGRKAMVGVIDAAAEEGDLFLDFLRECE